MPPYRRHDHIRYYFDTVLIQIIQRQQFYLSTLFTFKQLSGEASEREDIIVVFAAFSEYGGIVSDQLKLINADLLVAVFAGADDVFIIIG